MLLVVGLLGSGVNGDPYHVNMPNFVLYSHNPGDADDAVTVRGHAALEGQKIVLPAKSALVYIPDYDIPPEVMEATPIDQVKIGTVTVNGEYEAPELTKWTDYLGKKYELSGKLYTPTAAK